jgi:hypothetical protein
MRRAKKKTNPAFAVLDSLLTGEPMPSVHFLSPITPGTGKTALILEWARRHPGQVIFLAHEAKG